jgi:PEP-CTERM motif
MEPTHSPDSKASKLAALVISPGWAVGRAPALLLAIVALCALAPRAASAYSAAHAIASASASCGPGDSGNDLSEASPYFAQTVAGASGGSSDPLVCNPSSPGFGVPSFAGALAAANLRTGELRAYADASPGGSIVLSQSAGIARIWDTVTVLGPFQPFSTVARITLHVEGTLTGSAAVNASLQVVGTSTRSDYCVISYSSSFTCPGGVSPQGAFSYDVVMDVPVFSSSPTFQLYTEMNASAINPGVADASSTATLSIQFLHAGFTFTSGSGVLLVPEPSTLALAATGLAGLALYARSRRRNVAA